MPIDVDTVLLASAGLALAVSFAILAGILCARVLFRATRETEEDRP